MQGVRCDRAGVARQRREVGPPQGATLSGYKKYDFEIPIGQNGDTYDRYIVRMAEMRQSVRIMRQAVGASPKGRSWGKFRR